MTFEMLLTRWMPTYLLLLVRCGGVVVFGPVFGEQSLPRGMKTGLAAGLALLLIPLIQGQGLRLPADGLGLAGTLLGELTVGAILGLAVRFLFMGIGMAGEVAAIQMGIGMPATLDPHSMIQVTAVNHLLDQIAVLTFLTVNGHHAVLAALAQSLVLVPPLSVGFHGTTMEFLLNLFGAALLLAIRLAAPVGAAMLATMVTLGLLHRVAPQANLFMLSFTLTIGIGLLVLLAALPLLVAGMEGSFRELPASLATLLTRMQHGL